jgi:hypothetical protein
MKLIRTMSRRRRCLSGVVAAAALVLPVGVTLAGPADAAVTCVSHGTSVGFSEGLLRGQCIKSSNGRYTLVFQSDGNLVSYRNSDMTVCFNAGSQGRSANTVSVFHLAGASAPIYLEVANESPAQGSYHKTFPGSGSGTLNVSVGNSHGEMYVGYTAYSTGRC